MLKKNLIVALVASAFAVSVRPKHRPRPLRLPRRKPRQPRQRRRQLRRRPQRPRRRPQLPKSP